MTAKELYEYALIEINKLEAPSLLLEDYNHFINKAIYQYINLKYNGYDINQQSTDDLGSLKTTVVLTPIKNEESNSKLLESVYYVLLPKDYVHLLGCIIEYDVSKNFKCYEAGSKTSFGCRRLTSDMYSQILHNYYMRPMYKRPYYFINNVNTQTSVVTNPEMDDSIKSSSFLQSLQPQYDRTSSPVNVRLELRFGNDDSVFIPSKLYVDYVKSPMFVKLTEAQVDSVVDTSQVLEYPDYVCYEIINNLVKLLMENASDPRLQTHIPVNTTIASGNPSKK